MVVIFCAPSGSGKSTIVHHLLSKFSDLEFSISATSRPLRGNEKNGVDYYFISEQDFRSHIAAGDFLEYEEVYAGRFYGTLRSEVDRIEGNGHHVIFDIDVKGGLNLKRIFGDRALAIFIAPPSIETLRERLIGRGTDSDEMIEQRVAKASIEMEDAPYFDKIIVNDVLEHALAEAEKIVDDFLHGKN